MNIENNYLPREGFIYMKFLNKTSIGLLLVLFNGEIHRTIAMEMPTQEITQGKRSLLKKFLEAEKRNDFEFYKTRSSYALESVIPVVVLFLEDKNEFESLRKELKTTQGELRKLLNNVIKNADRALTLSPVVPQAAVGSIEERKKLFSGGAVKQSIPAAEPLQIEISNHTSEKIVKAWIATGPNTWELSKLSPFQDSKVFALAKDSTVYLYIGSQEFLLLQKDKTLILSKEFLTDKYMGQLVNPYPTTEEVKRINLKEPAKIIIVINPDSSITFSEKV